MVSEMRSVVLVLLSLVLTASAWDEGDFEVFDVVEEVNQNFYELLGVKQVILSFYVNLCIRPYSHEIKICT